MEVIAMAFNSKKSYTYDDLPELIGYLKRAAIDAYVISEESYFLEWYDIKGDSYQKNTISENIGPGAEFITRPGTDGEGGGKNTSGGSAELISEFDEVRNSIDAIIQKWRALPETRYGSTEINDWVKVSSVLADRAATIDGISRGQGTIGADILQARTWIGEMNGAVIGEFSSFVSKLESVVGGLSDEVTLWGGALNSEIKMLEEMKSSVVETVIQGINAFNKVASDDSGDIDIALRVVETAVDAFLAFTAPSALAAKQGASGAVKCVSGRNAANGSNFVLKGVSSLKNDSPGVKEVDDYSSALEALREAFKALNENVKKVEKGVRKTLNDNVKVMQENRDSYDVTLKPIDSSGTGKQDGLVMNLLTVKNINAKMYDIAREVRRAGNDIVLVSLSDCIFRHSKIGLGPSGPSKAFNEMRDLLSRLLLDLADDVENEAKNFELAAEAIVEQDTATKARLDQMAQGIRSNRTDPWSKKAEPRTGNRHSVKGNRIV